MTKHPIKSVAAKVINDPSQDAESRSLAGYVLGDRSAQRTTQPATRHKHELQDLLRKIEGMEGQTERAADIRAQIEGFDTE